MELFLILICLIAPPVFSLSIKTKLNPRIVQTRYGKIQGVVQSFEYVKFLKPIDVYLGIPYATPPVGGNRFSPTRAPSPWDGVRLSDSVGPVCPQKLPDISNEQEALERMPKGRLEYLRRLLPHLRNQSEDCLYLNIYAPAMGTSESGRKHPVLLFVHGESYDYGSGNPYDGSVLASYTDQVVVTMNYRLGVLGFLNANMAPHLKARVANYGLMDQIAVLQWVQQNIGLFGGDPGNVTLMGQGTGAACVNFLAISPTVRSGLFKRAILLSGSALSSWAVVDDPGTYALKLARATNCSIPEDLFKDHELIVDCLRDANLNDLLQVDIQAPTFLSAFGPSVDGVVINPDFQKDLLSYLGPEFQGFGQQLKRTEHGTPITSNNKYDLLFGVTTSEALWKFAEKDVQQGFEGDRRDRIIRTYVRNAYTYHLTEIFYTVVNEYTDWERTVQHPVNTRDACVQALSDAQFVAPLVQTGDLFTLRHMKKPNNPHVAPISEDEREPMPKTYFYVFDYQTKDGDYPQRMGSVHGEELPFVFGAPLVDGFGHFPKNYTKPEIALSESLILSFANFVRTGNPNAMEHHGRSDAFLPASREKSRFRSVTWEQYDPVHQKYLEIGLKPRMKNHYRAHQLSVWLRLVPELHRAGMEDVEPRHNLFRGHADPSLYDGSVRPDPLSRIGEEYRRRNATTEPPTTTDYSITTCVSLIQSTNLQNVHNASTDTLASLDAAGYAAYSTALSVTIAIGCSLLILNVLIFAGVYYQRDKTRLEVKSLQQQQMMNQQCGPRGFTELKQPPPPHSHFPGSGQVIVDVENEMLRRNAMKAQPSDANALLQQGQGTHTLPHQHHYQKHQHQQHATLPRASMIQDMNTQTQGPPNGSIHLTIPRAPPPPRTKSPPENQPLLQGATVSSRVSQATISEMRV
ncbi:neuroligin-4, X-linked [Cephus cinctus]|uniref:Neuroligin-4, X-linked n=1 Tax=Cephus cinctus TaxID=211228 RepID=A0AAJ7BK63_CEPCN|nr:neuroligin-4, X-linked [Cephus cinctus]XP_015588031.1 neuroligin-4, X-linked [Cephus cinctus]XP_015588035.1 neuroligin-4, X-linked [Cephus cinctus]XP_024937164.1 neuroligin-4, X-linked [Cephus cinctus]XP_024937165.1 neuroligin-4, X-linked [Cephus cinctus]XP_024937166.1 neuroligin-4, X-linked [Cephus cinctus]XP_024937167.1 neuroligin-4, X-linked [Cephus cinctus]XP_024937168.1 neuroligin-4, X-linked [Cephus cinctus]XP_024937169.1 neuroligin-4, X-linked [Cephus cinctus]